MSKGFWVTLVMLLGLALAASPAWAQGHGNGGGKGRDKDNRAERRDRDRDWDRDRDRHRDRDGVRGQDRDDDHDRDNHALGGPRHGRPPGWDHGKKVGWGNCDVPPGLAKKEGCRHLGRRYPRTTRTQPIVRRPHAHVQAHGGVDAEVH